MAEKQTSKDRMREIVDSIENGIKELFESDKYRKYLATMSRFHRYSVNNTIKDGYHLEHRDSDFLFLNDGLAIRIQHRRIGFRVGLDFLDLFLIGSRSDDADTFFAFQDVPAELIAPLVEARHMGGVGALHIDEHAQRGRAFHHRCAEILGYVLQVPLHG